MDDLARELALLKEFGFTHLDIRSSESGVRGSLAPNSEPRTPNPDELNALAAVAHDCTKCRLSSTWRRMI